MARHGSSAPPRHRLSLRLMPYHLLSHGGGPNTPLPRWNLYENPSYDCLAVSAGACRPNHCVASESARRRAVSARKLAASLWEEQEIPVSAQPLLQQDVFSLRGPGSKGCEGSSPCSHFERDPSSTSTSDSWQPLKCCDRLVRPIRSEIDVLSHSLASSEMSKLGDAGSVSSSKHSTKVLKGMRTLEEQQNASMSLVEALRLELEYARKRVRDLEFDHKSARKEIDRRVAEEGVTLSFEEQERIKAALQSVREEFKEERKARRRLQALNRKLSRDLLEANKALARAVEELEREGKARKLLEDVCDELAIEIGQDKAETEQLKIEHAKVREEVEEERKMLQMAEIWREERVQMKLEEARLELEERTLALIQLRNELEAFLTTHRNSETEEKSVHEADIREAEMLIHAIDSLKLDESKYKSYQQTDSNDSGYKLLNEVIYGKPDFNLQGDNLINCTEVGSDNQSRESLEGQISMKHRRWTCRASSKSEGNKANGFYAFGGIQIDNDSDVEYESYVEDESRVDEDSEWECTDENNAEGKHAVSDCSADWDENGEENSPWYSVNEIEGEENGLMFSGDFSQEHGKEGKEARIRHQKLTRGIWRVGWNEGESCMINSKAKKEIDIVRDFRDEDMALATRHSSMLKPSKGLQDPGFELPQICLDACDPQSSRGRGCFLDWPKSFSSNSLQAKLLEARTENKNAVSSHLIGLKYKI